MQIPSKPNPALEAGSWVKYQDAEFLIAHAGNMKFQRAMARLQRPFRRKIEKGEMDPVDQRNIIIQAMAEAILLGWKGVVGEGNEPAEYSRELAQTLLKNDEAFRDFVMEYAMDMQNFSAAEQEHEGNS
jgi:hypothetical protein